MSSAKKYTNAYLAEQAISRYERSITEKTREDRDFFKEEATAFVNEAFKAKKKAKKNGFDRKKFLKNAKKFFMEECLYKVFDSVLESSIPESENIVPEETKHNMVYNLIEECGGVDSMLTDFYDKNIFLSEIAKCVDHYYELVVSETCRKEKECPVSSYDDNFYKIPKDVQDDFYKELEDADFGDVTIQISNRVTDAIEQFISDNNDTLTNIKDVLANTKEKVETNKSVDESVHLDTAGRAVNRIKNNRSMNVFATMVEQMGKTVMKDDNMYKAFTEGASLDIGKIKGYCATSYSLLEMANSLKILRVNSEYIENMLKSI